MIRPLLCALLITGCTTIDLTKNYRNIDPIRVNLDERAFDVRIRDDRVFVIRELKQGYLSSGFRYVARRLEVSDWEFIAQGYEKEIAKLAAVSVFPDGCKLAKQGDGSTKFFVLNASATQFMGVLDCRNQ